MEEQQNELPLRDTTESETESEFEWEPEASGRMEGKRNASEQGEAPTLLETQEEEQAETRQENANAAIAQTQETVVAEREEQSDDKERVPVIVFRPLGDSTTVLFPRLVARSRRQAPVDAVLEESVMKIVLRHAPKFATAHTKSVVWDAIAKASRGRYVSGEQAGSRTSWLCKVLKNPHHVEFGKLTPTLREMLLEFLKFEVAPANTEKSTNRLACTEPTETEPTPATTPKVSRTVLQPANDERLMQLVLENPMAGMFSSRKRRTWDHIVATLQDPRVLSGASGAQRVRALVRVFQDPSHNQHDRLTPRLRQQIAQYLAANEQRLQIAQDLAANESSKTNEAAETRSRGVHSQEPKSHAEEVFPVPTPKECEALLRELLRVRPFHARRGRVVGEWERVAATMRRDFGKKSTLATGKACVVQMKRLLHAVREPNRAASVHLSPQLIQKVALLQTLVKTRWPQAESQETEKHRLLRARVDQFVRSRGDAPSRVESATTRLTRCRVAANAVEDGCVKEVSVGGGIGEAIEKASEDPVKPLAHDQTRKRKAQADPVAMSPQHKTKSIDHRSLSVALSEIDSLRAEVAQLASMKNESCGVHVQMLEMLKEERDASTRERLALLEILKKEQADRKHEFVAMMNLVTTAISQQSKDRTTPSSA